MRRRVPFCLSAAKSAYDVGTEELGHLEIVGAIVHQLTRKMTIEE